jgi:hypothetical protein
MQTLVALAALAFAVTGKPAPKQSAGPAPELRQLAFWVGEWDATGRSRTTPGKDVWAETKASNSIAWILDGHVVHESFTMGGFKGMSVSTYSVPGAKWQQTWVDNQGGYIDLRGGMQGDKMILTTLPKPKVPNRFSRMIFENIKKDSFDWNWESSSDGGKTWELGWHLHYTRKNSRAK